MPHPFDFPPLPLEQGIAPLSRFFSDSVLPPDQPYEAAYALLAAWACESAMTAKMWAMDAAAPQTRRQLSLLQRIDMSAACRLRLLLRGFSLADQCLYGAFAALEWCAACVQRLGEGALRRVLEFVLPECLDILYRLSNWRALAGEPPAYALLRGYAEIMPGRPMIACHRHPYDGVLLPEAQEEPFARLALPMAQAVFAGQRVLFAHAAALAKEAEGQALLMEAAMLSQAHETRFLSLQPMAEPLAQALDRQAACAYLLFSWAEKGEAAGDSSNGVSGSRQPSEGLRPLILFLRDHACNQLRALRGLCDAELAHGAPPLPDFPPALTLGPNKGCIRDMLESVGETAERSGYAPVGTLAKGADFFRYQRRVCGEGEEVPSHRVIVRVIEKQGQDERYEIAPHPIEALRDRTRDATQIGR